MPNVETIENDDNKTVLSKNFRVLFDAVNQAIFLFNFMGDILEVNNNACELLDYSREKLMKMTLHDIISPEFASKIPEGVQKTIQNGSRTFESAVVHRDGTLIPVETYLKIINLFDSNVIYASVQETTEWKRKDNQIIEFKEVFDNLPNPIFKVKTKSVIYANEAAIDIFEIEEGDIITPEFEGMITDAINTNSQITTEITFKNQIYTLDTLPIQEEESVIIYGRDITEHRNAEKMIDYLAKFPSENPNPLLWVNQNSVLYSNQAGENLFKVRKDSNIPEFLKTAVDNALKKNEFSEKEVEFDNRIYLLNLSRVQNQDYISIQGIDISERKKAEKVLKQYSHQMEFLNHIIMTGNVASDIKLFLEEILNSTLDLMGFYGGVIYLVDEIEKIAEVVCSRNVPSISREKNKMLKYRNEPYKTVFIKGLPQFLDYSPTLYSHDALFSGFLSLASIPIFSKNKIIGAISIASKIKYTFSQEEKEILELIGREIGALIIKMQTEEALNEASSITDFYKDLVVHDISNIFQNIDISVELLSLFQKREEKIEDIIELIDNVKEQIGRGANLIANIRKLSKISSTGISLEPIESQQVLNDAVKLIQVSFPNKNLNIKIESQLKKVFVRANEFLLDVFENILFNAVKYNNNSSVEIEILVLKCEYNGKNYLRLEFKDNGIGISEQRKETILISISEGKRKVKGMGIGLFTVNKIIKNYEGKIWIEDRIQGDPSKGSNFIILIPLVM